MPRSDTARLLTDVAKALLVATLLALAGWLYHAEQRLTRMESDQEALAQQVTELSETIKEQRIEANLSLQKLHADLFAIAMKVGGK